MPNSSSPAGDEHGTRNGSELRSAGDPALGSEKKRSAHPPIALRHREQETHCGELHSIAAARPESSASRQTRTGRSVRGSYFPVPLSCTVCVPTASWMFKVALRVPVTVGVNVTVIVQSQCALRLAPQVDVSVKSPGFVPPNVMLVMVSVLLWLLVRITVAAFFVATVTDP